VTLFDRLAKFSGGAVDRVMGEPVRITPRLALPKRPLAGDGDRAVVELVARFTLEPETVELEGQRRGTDLGGFTRMQGAEAVLVISAIEAEKLTYRLRTGDLIEMLALKHAERPRWSALTPLPSSGGLLVIPLTREP
jgi:hypothetical protein